MNQFTADYSSSPPSTPNARAQQPPMRNRPLFGDLSNHPSTTPAGPPPPSSAASFTPAGLPPSTAFGSSRFGTGVSKLQFMKDSISSSAPTRSPPPSHSQLPPRTKNGTPAKSKSRVFQAPGNSLANSRDPLTQSYAESIEEGDEEDYDETMEHGDDENEAQPGSPAFKGFTSVNAGPTRREMPTSTLFQSGSKGPKKQSFRTSVARNQDRGPRLSQLPSKGKEELVPGIARDIAAQSPPASLTESDNVILHTEAVMRQLDEETQNLQDKRYLPATTTQHAHQLIQLWRHYTKSEAIPQDVTNIGPLPSASPFEKANYLASLLLALFHPPSTQAPVQSNPRLSGRKNLFVVPVSKSRAVPVPQILLDWLDNYHVSYESLFRTVNSTVPNCASHDLFWDAVQSLLLRGKIREVTQLLADADFKYAGSALDDGSKEPGYQGAQLQVVQGIIYRARQVLEGCPGAKAADWQTDGPDWDLYRKRVMTELEYLTRLADGQEVEEEDEEFEAENFGIHKAGIGLLGRSMQTPTSGIPWTIFQNLKIMYSILIGSAEEIIAQSQDWLEAATSLTIWWDGAEDDGVATWSLNVSRSHVADERTEGTDPYLARLRAAFLCVTDPDQKDSFQINTMSPTEVGIGAVLQGNVEAVLAILQTFSLCVASAVAEVGSSAGWLANSSPSSAPGFDQDDLMVLSYGGHVGSNNKDDLLHAYAEALFQREELSQPNGDPVEGWELALSITVRLDDQEMAQATCSDFLDQLQLTNQDRMDKVVTLCTDLGLEKEARKVSERFADHLINNTSMYGTALLCYARSHAAPKIRQVVDLLVSYCLVQSISYPQDDEMDDNLRLLVENPKAAFSGLAEVDSEAAEILRFHLVGYACVRRFYGLRDEEIMATKSGRKPSTRPLARRRTAAKALVAAINSAADAIYGGLYDAERQSAIQVDGLLTLLGEATAFLAKTGDMRVLTSAQMYALLAAIEDLQTVNKRVYDATEECLEAALRNYHGSLPPSPHAMLKKSVSSGTNSNFSFSMMGSEMLNPSETSAGGKSVGSMVLVGGTGQGAGDRGWDWRAQFKDKSTTGADVLKVLRLGIAKELSEAEVDDGDGMVI